MILLTKSSVLDYGHCLNKTIVRYLYLSTLFCLRGIPCHLPSLVHSFIHSFQISYVIVVSYLLMSPTDVLEI